MLVFKYGDILTAFKESTENVILLHGCNCFHTMGAGLAKQIVAVYPDALRADKEQTAYGNHHKLGKYSTVVVAFDNDQNPKKIIANGYTQYHYGSGRLFIESALTEIIMRLAKDYRGYKIMMPYIGAGLAGGTRDDTKSAINLAFKQIALCKQTKNDWADVLEPEIRLFER